MKAPTLALAALIALYGASSTTHALTAKTIEKNCKAIKVCYRGGVQANVCTLAESNCPPCVTFDNNGCFEEKSTGGCNFGSLCTTYWEEDDSSTSTSSGSESSTASSKSSSNEAGNGAIADKNSTNSTTASSSSGAGTAGTAGSSSSDSGGSDMSVVFAIIGAAMGVIAVAIIFLTLVRRSRAAHEDEDDVATPPAAMGKEPVSTTAGVTYASYARGRGTSGASGGVPVAEATSNTNVANYYSQQPKDLPIASPRVAGRAVPAATATASAASTNSVVNYYAQKPQDLPVASPRVAGRAVPASAPRPQPVPAPAARAMPMFANKVPLSNQQYQQPQEVAYHQQAPAPVQVQEAPRRPSSPRNRRESFEF